MLRLKLTHSPVLIGHAQTTLVLTSDAPQTRSHGDHVCRTHRDRHLRRRRQPPPWAQEPGYATKVTYLLNHTISKNTLHNKV